jgi:glutathione S-transferase
MSLLHPVHVALYGHPECPACRHVRGLLDAAGWVYEFVLLDPDAPGKAGEELRICFPRWSGFIPVLVIDSLCVELGENGVWESFAPWAVPRPAPAEVGAHA